MTTPDRDMPTGAGSDHDAARRLVILTNIPTPYRTPFFNSLHDALREYDAVLHVVYCASREPNRHWKVELSEQRYSWEILHGWHPTVRSWYPHVNLRVVHAMRRLRPTWLLSGGAWNTPSVLLASSRILAGRYPRIFWSEGHQNAVRHPSGIVARARRRALRAYDAFAVPNEASEIFIRAEVGAAARVIRLPNTVDDEFYSDLRRKRRPQARSRLGIAEGQRVLISVAQLEERKGTLELISAYEQLPLEIRERTVLSLIGDGALRNGAESRASQIDPGSVRILGHLEREDIGDWLAAADAFVLPTKRDPNPLSVIEAAFAGLPLVVSRLAGNSKELVLDGETGYLIERPEPASIAAALCRLFENEASWQEMGAQSAKIATAGFRRKMVARDFVRALADTMGNVDVARQ